MYISIYSSITAKKYKGFFMEDKFGWTDWRETDPKKLYPEYGLLSDWRGSFCNDLDFEVMRVLARLKKELEEKI